MAEARIDKWMWAVRIFKTRTIAAEACKKGRITINGSLVKAARMIKPGDVIQVKKPLPCQYADRKIQTACDHPPKYRGGGFCVPTLPLLERVVDFL